MEVTTFTHPFQVLYTPYLTNGEKVTRYDENMMEIIWYLQCIGGLSLLVMLPFFRLKNNFWGRTNRSKSNM